MEKERNGDRDTSIIFCGVKMIATSDDNLIVEVPSFCMLCKKQYKAMKLQKELKGEGMRVAREIGAKLFPGQGIMAIPHGSCVKKTVSNMLLQGQRKEVELIAKGAGMTFEEYLEVLNL